MQRGLFCFGPFLAHWHRMLFRTVILVLALPASVLPAQVVLSELAANPSERIVKWSATCDRRAIDRQRHSLECA
jgi:hypothetical protein